MARHAVFTIVQDDPTNLRIWAGYYRKHYPDVDTYVLHHPTIAEPFYANWILDVRDDCGEQFLDRGFELVPVFREESFNHTWLRETVQHFQRFLLQSYDTVLFTEVDEIVVPVVPAGWKLENLRADLDWLAKSSCQAIRCAGYEIVHDYAVEPPIDYELPLLSQRSKWYPSLQYSKTLLSKVPLTWVNGFHTVAPPDRSQPIDPGWLLLHLHKLDFNHALARHKRSAAQKWARHDKATGQGIQNQVADESWLRNWWYDTVDHPGTRAKLVAIPEGIKGTL